MSRISLHSLALLAIVVTMGQFASKAEAQPVFPPAFVGSYQGLLQAPSNPADVNSAQAPFGRIDFTVSSKGAASGKLLLVDRKSYSFTSPLLVDPNGPSAAITGLVVVKQKTTNATLLNLSLTINSDGTFSASGTSTLLTIAQGSFTQVPGTAVKVALFTSKAPSPLAGAYTFSFSDPTPTGDGVPSSSGYATGTISAASGVLSIKGKLGDGTSITGSSKPDSSGRYSIYLTPYSIVGGYFTAAFQLTQRADNKYHVADGAAAWVQWKKMANIRDKVFASGFGPLDLFLTAAQWTLPGKGQNAATVLGLSQDEIFGLGLENVINATTYAKRLPLKLGINTNNTLRVSAGGAGSPDPADVKQWATFFSGKVDPKTGLITATIKIEDIIPPTPPSTKSVTVKRSVVFTGVMFQLPDTSLDPIARGFAVIPPLNSKTGVTTYGKFGFTTPIEIDTIYQRVLATAGSYLTNLTMLTPATPAPSGLPNITRPVPFTISSDLKSINFAGRTIPLSGDSRPVALSFTNAPSSPRNNLTVTIYLNTSTGLPTGLNANYYQVSISGFIPTIKIRNYTAAAADITKQ